LPRDWLASNRRLLYEWALRLCGAPADAEDLVQLTVERVLRVARDRQQSIANHEAYCLGILHHAFIDELRRRRSRESAGDVHAMELPDTAEPAPDWSDFTDREVEVALARLDDGDREVLLMKERDGLTYEEIGRRIGIASTVTVGTRLHRVRRRVREELLRLRGLREGA
jgi:RNA polymerase sigma-70 factor (ECF subfamily)